MGSLSTALGRKSSGSICHCPRPCRWVLNSEGGVRTHPAERKLMPHSSGPNLKADSSRFRLPSRAVPTPTKGRPLSTGPARGHPCPRKTSEFSSTSGQRKGHGDLCLGSKLKTPRHPGPRDLDSESLPGTIWDNLEAEPPSWGACAQSLLTKPAALASGGTRAQKTDLNQPIQKVESSQVQCLGL